MLQIQTAFFVLALVMFKLYSNNKLTAISMVSLAGILVNKQQTS